MSSIRIRPATLADADDIFRVHYAALATFHEFYAAIFQGHPRDFLPNLTEKALKNTDNKFLVAVEDATEKIIGFTRYKIDDPSHEKKEVKAEPTNKVSTEEKPQPSPMSPKAHLKELWEQFDDPRQEEIDAAEAKASDNKKHYFVQHLMIDPQYQRKGIGGKLLSEVVSRADADGLPTVLVSSFESHGLYLKLGFEDIQKFTIDNGDLARKIRACEIDNGLPPSDDLVAKYEGVTETEHVMIRRVR